MFQHIFNGNLKHALMALIILADNANVKPIWRKEPECDLQFTPATGPIFSVISLTLVNWREETEFFGSAQPRQRQPIVQRQSLSALRVKNSVSDWLILLFTKVPTLELAKKTDLQSDLSHEIGIIIVGLTQNE